MTDHAFTIVVDDETHAALVADADDARLQPEALVTDLLRARYAELRADPEYETWYRREIAAAVKDADDPHTVWYSNEEVEADFKTYRDELSARSAPSPS